MSDIQAQSKVTWGLRAGLNISNAGGNFKDKDYMGGDDTSFPAKVGFNLGVIADIELGKGFYLQPGLYFSNKGINSKYEYSEEGYEYKYNEKYGLNYFEIPILASYKLGINESLRWEVNFGPYIAVGIAGKTKFHTEETGEPDLDEDIPAFGVEYDEENYEYKKGGLNRFDFGLQFGTGLTIKDHYYVGLRYDLGLLNAFNTSDKDSQWHEFNGKDKDDIVGKLRNFSICIGYNF